MFVVEYEEKSSLPPVSAYDEEYAADPFSPAASPTYPTSTARTPVVPALYIPESKAVTSGTDSSHSQASLEDNDVYAPESDYLCDMVAKQPDGSHLQVDESSYQVASMDQYQPQSYF